jgi:hypothetical protein
MKVPTFLLRTGQSLLIWIATNILACLILLVVLSFTRALNYSDYSIDNGLGFYSSFFIVAWVFVIGLVLSAPVNLVLVPSLYLLARIPSRSARVLYAIFSILLLCAGVALLFYSVFGLDAEEGTMMFILPYIPAAEICFFLIALKLILHGSQKTTTINTSL